MQPYYLTDDLPYRDLNRIVDHLSNNPIIEIIDPFIDRRVLHSTRNYRMVPLEDPVSDINAIP